MWFEKLTGFKEESPTQVREKLYIAGDKLVSRVTNRSFLFGSLALPNLAELRLAVNALNLPQRKIKLQECIADVQELHTRKENIGAFFQVASQFNLLEMVSPEVTPDAGIDDYEYDCTQGPACAIAAGAGTIYRNYFVTINNQAGQSKHHQINTLADLGKALGNKNDTLWKMKNGYALVSEEGLEIISRKLKNATESEVDQLREYLRIGIQTNTEVTLNNLKHSVTQAYCSALPVAYSPHPPELWEGFAQLILEAAYEATLCAAIINYTKTNNPNVYLTLLGGGAFGNKEQWILNAIESALLKYNHIELNIHIVSYRFSNPNVKALVERFTR